MKLFPERSALLVVDLQNDFCPGGALGVRDGDAVVSPINSLMVRFRHVVLTQDWHPVDHVSFAANWPGRNVHDRVELGGGEQELWPIHCVAGSRGAEFNAFLETRRASLLLRKGMRRTLDSYSALFENDHRSPTGLEHWLRGVGASTLYLAGLATDYCVYYTAMDALLQGFEVAVVLDCVRGVDVPAGGVERRLESMSRAGAVLINSAEIE